MKYFHLIWAALARSKTRTLLTLMSVVAAFLLFAIACSQSRLLVLKKWASVAGVVVTPFWIWTAAHAGRTDMTAFSAAMLFIWLVGFYNHWISPPDDFDPEWLKTGCSD